ncbi:MAG TPA: sporulation protein Cse60 [Bacillales bacterium]|nr:sporulation protein Cse60 [Bacillales bacterium]
MKLFDAEHEADLEEELNAFLAEVPENLVKDVKYGVAAAADEESGAVVCSFSAMVLYSERR